ncbi:MAG: L-threonine 3-dehydrogenase [Planctomycetes bacterium RBG_16_43_13]|nr:MAG: L-threonine 3-dehydrogenase [Planctomycetes bacterium RBG_16_43_13]
MPKMKAIMKKEPSPGATVVDAEIPTIRSDEVLIKVKAASICGTDLHIYNWDSWAQSYIKPPRIFGHEFCGEVVEVGKDVKNFHIPRVRAIRTGDFVSAESHIPCGKCPQCLSDNMHICENIRMIGGDVNGGYAEYVAIPAICAWKHNKPIKAEIASIFEPMGNSVHVVMAANVEGKSVAIFGCGPTGLFAIGVAKAVGARKVIAIDVNKLRLELAQDMKADEIINGKDYDLLDRIRNVDVVLEMSGSSMAITNGLVGLKKGGTFIAFGLPSEPPRIDIANLVIMKEIKIKGIFGRLMFKTWEDMDKLIESGRLDPSPAITHHFPLTQFDEAIKTIKATDIKCGKVVLIP